MGKKENDEKLMAAFHNALNQSSPPSADVQEAAHHEENSAKPHADNKGATLNAESVNPGNNEENHPQIPEPLPLEVMGGPMRTTRRGTLLPEDVLDKRRSMRRRSIAADADHRRKSLLAKVMLSKAVEEDKAKSSAEFDGVHWRISMKDYFRKSAKQWPPAMCCGWFCAKGYYKDWSEDTQRQSRYFSRYLDSVDSEDELTKAENVAYGKAQIARDKGLPEAAEWESYDSEDSADNGRIIKKLRRKSLILRHPNLVESHEERKREYERRKADKRRHKKEGQAYPRPDYSPFVGNLRKTTVDTEKLAINTASTTKIGEKHPTEVKTHQPTKKVAPEHKDHPDKDHHQHHHQ